MSEARLLHHVIEAEGPTVGLAVDAGHDARPDLLHLTRFDEAGRLQEAHLRELRAALAGAVRAVTRAVEGRRR